MVSFGEWKKQDQEKVKKLKKKEMTHTYHT